MCASLTKGTHYREKYTRIRKRRGAGRAVLATAHAILRAAYHMLKRGDDYRELGPYQQSETEKKQLAQKLRRRLERLGFEVEVKPKAA